MVYTQNMHIITKEVTNLLLLSALLPKEIVFLEISSETLLQYTFYPHLPLLYIKLLFRMMN